MSRHLGQNSVHPEHDHDANGTRFEGANGSRVVNGVFLPPVAGISRSSSAYHSNGPGPF
ncbi:MAG TPA: hypothetical protein VGL82_04950 [Bryobacteraceae bacterium]